MLVMTVFGGITFEFPSPWETAHVTCRPAVEWMLLMMAEPAAASPFWVIGFAPASAAHQNVPIRHERLQRVIRSKIGVLDPAKGIPQDAVNIGTGRPGVGGLLVQGGVLIGSNHERAAILQPHGWTQFEAKRRAG